MTKPGPASTDITVTVTLPTETVTGLAAILRESYGAEIPPAYSDAEVLVWYAESFLRTEALRYVEHKAVATTQAAVDSALKAQEKAKEAARQNLEALLSRFLPPR